MIITLHLSVCGTNRLLSHHFFKSAKALLRLLVNALMVSATQYEAVSSAYEYVSAERTDFNFRRSFVKRENKVGPRTEPRGTLCGQ